MTLGDKVSALITAPIPAWLGFWLVPIGPTGWYQAPWILTLFVAVLLAWGAASSVVAVLLEALSPKFKDEAP
jgi:hypothetical protein